MTITDIFLRYKRLYFDFKIDSKKILARSDDWKKLHGKPKCLTSDTDNGRQYTSNRLKDYLVKEYIGQSLVSIYSPKSNGISPSRNKTIAFILSIKKRRKIKDIIRLIERTININYNRTLSTAPPSIINKYSAYNSLKRKVKIKKYFDESPIIKFNENDIVYYKNHRSKELDKKYKERKGIVFIGNKGWWVKLESENNFRHVSDLKL